MSLFWKIFLSFGAAMAMTLVATVYVSFQLAQEAFDPVQIEARDPIVREAALALADGGERNLREWLRENSRQDAGRLLLIVEEDCDELLGRAIPSEMRRLLQFGNLGPNQGQGGCGRRGRGDGMGTGGRGQPPNLRPAQLTPDLVGPDGDEYRLVFVRPPVTVFGVIAWPGSRLAIGSIALLVAAFTSFALARYISWPIARLQRASRALAAGALETRVGATRRSDEVGILSRDFDTMAERIQALITDKETLLRDVSHELRSPLARIRMALALAQRRANDDAQSDLTRIETEAERLDELIGQIMTLARLRTQQEPHRERLSLDALVQQIVEDARYEHPESTVNFTPGGNYDLIGDAQGLRSAIENVIRNALHYAGADGPINVEIERIGEELELRVRDSGSGVRDEDLSRIFEPLYRADESRDHQDLERGPQTGGTAGQGVGLAITARVMELHDGTARAANRASGGLEVALRLPTGLNA